MNKNLKYPLINKPALAAYYESAHKQVLNRTCYIRKNEYPMFETFSDDLRELNIGCRDYAYAVVKLLQSWLQEKKFYRIPVNVFCGDWALNKFKKIDDSQYVRITEPEEDKTVEIVQSELLVARAYIEYNLKDVYRMKDVVKDLRPLLSKEWLECPEDKRPITEVLEMLCKDYGLPLTSSYNNVIRSLQCRQK